jgi:hypothetical protein
MNTVKIEERLEYFYQFLANTVSHQEDSLLNASDPVWAGSYQMAYNLVRNIESEFTRTFSTEPTVRTDEQT